MDEPELRREMLREVKLAGIVPVPVAAMTDGSACWRSHSMVSPSDLCPSSRVSWNTLAAQRAGIRIRRPRPSTFVCRSLVEVLLGGGFLGEGSEEGVGRSWLLLLEVEGSAEMAKEGYGEEVEQEEGSWGSSFFSSSWNGKFCRWWLWLWRWWW